ERVRRRKGVAVPRLAARPDAARAAQSKWRPRCADQRRVRSPAGVVRTPGPRAVARQSARSDAGPDRRLVRTFDRCPDQPHSPQDRSRFAEPGDHQDGAIRRLPVHAGGEGRLMPRTTSLWKMLGLDRIGSQMAALVLVSTVAIHAVIATTFYLSRPE